MRNSDLNLKWSNKITIYLAKLNSLLSHFIPDKIISCSNKSTQTHLQLGYCKRKIVLIDNGFDTTKFNFKKKYRTFGDQILKFIEKILFSVLLVGGVRKKIFKHFFMLLEIFCLQKKTKRKLNYYF